MKNKNLNYSYDEYLYNDQDDLDSFEENTVTKINPKNDFEDEFYENYIEDNVFSDGDSDAYDYDYDKWIE